MNKELFSEQLIAQRKAKGYENQNQFADAYNEKFPPKRKDEAGGNIGSGILGTIKHYENPNYTKSMPSLDKVLNMCDLLDCDIDYLTGRLNYTTHNLKYICEYTGLSSEAVDIVHSLQVDNERSLEIQMINALFTSELFNKRFLKTLIDVFVYRNTLAEAINEAKEAFYHPRVGSGEKRDELQNAFKDIRFAILDYSDASQEMLHSLLPDLREIIAEAERLINRTLYEGSGPHFNDTWGYGKKDKEESNGKES